VAQQTAFAQQTMVAQQAAAQSTQDAMSSTAAAAAQQTAQAATATAAAQRAATASAATATASAVAVQQTASAATATARAAVTLTPSPTRIVLLETLQVPASGAAVSSRTSLKSGVSYRLRASGTITVDCCAAQGDAEWVRFPNGQVSHTCGTTPDVMFGIGVNDTGKDASRTPFWGAFNSARVYEIGFVGLGAPITLDYHDCFYHDNSGSLTVEILGPPTN
jgi:hypothetical protein